MKDQCPCFAKATWGMQTLVNCIKVKTEICLGGIKVIKSSLRDTRFAQDKLGVWNVQIS